MADDLMCSCGHSKGEHDPMGLVAPCFYTFDEHVGKHEMDIFCSCGDFSESMGFGPGVVIEKNSP